MNNNSLILSNTQSAFGIRQLFQKCPLHLICPYPGSIQNQTFVTGGYVPWLSFHPEESMMSSGKKHSDKKALFFNIGLGSLSKRNIWLSSQETRVHSYAGSERPPHRRPVQWPWTRGFVSITLAKS